MKKLLIAAGLLFITLFVSAPKALAATDTTLIKKFHARYDIFNDVRGGRMDVVETFDMQFTPNMEKHGPIRAIPTKYHDVDHRLQIVSVKKDGQEEPYTTSSQNNNEVLKIGDADVLVTGQTHTYEIKYEVTNIVNFLKDRDFDEWYWDINGDQWSHPLEKVSGEVHLPEGWDYQGLPSASCYTGKEGATQSVCTITQTETGYTFTTDAALQPYENLTVAVPLQNGFIEPRTTQDWLRENLWQFVGLSAGAVVAITAFRQWYTWGRDHKGKGVIVPEYEPPLGLSPAEVGLLYDYRLDSRDLTATLIDLAVRGYVKIYDEEKKTLGIFKSHVFKLELLNEKVGSLKSHEKSLLTNIFKQMVKGTTVDIADIDKVQMQATVTAIRDRMKKALVKQYGLLDETPLKIQFIVWGLAIVAAALIPLTGAGWGWVIGMVFGGLVAVVCGLLLRRRTHAGVEAYEKTKGLKLYMDTAEKERLQQMQSVDRPYAEPSHSVDLFEKLLPYAVALGVEKSWAKQFDNIYREQPGWYSGNMATFNTVYFTNSLASSVSTFNSSFSASAASTSSGSGGGGFSGGGGGGGGGGSW